MSKNLLLSLSLLFAMSFAAIAQERVITGQVNDASDDSGLPGVTIVAIKNGSADNTVGTTTDVMGQYTINVGEDVTSLRFSYIGYLPQTVEVGDQTVINVNLAVDMKQLEEVVVTALGVQREEKTLTYAAQSLKSSDLGTIPETNVANALSGRIAGVQIGRSATGPGGASQIVLRGYSSITGNNSPLIVVDGVPVSNNSSGIGGERGGITRGDGISNIDPNTIESMTVLKGASAAALYGNRASAGVIIITTKKGAASDRIGIDINSSVMVENAMLLMDFQNEYGQGLGGAYDRSIPRNWGAKLDGSSVATWSNDPADEGKSIRYSAQPNNVEDFFRTGVTLSNAISLHGGTEKTQGFFTYSHTDAKGIVPTNDMVKHNVNLRLSTDLTDKLNLDTKVAYTNQKLENRPIVGENFSSATRMIYRIPRNISLADAENFEYKTANGQTRQNLWAALPNGEQNPYWVVNRNTREEVRDRIIGFTALKYKFTDELSLQVRYGLDKTFDKNEFKWYNDSYVIAPAGDYQVENVQMTETNTDFLVSYNKVYDNEFSIGINAGGNIMKQKYSPHISLNGGLALENLFLPTNAASPLTTNWMIDNIIDKGAINGSEAYKRETQSLYASAQIGFKSSLFLDLTARNDWSSTLPSENRSFFYSSAGVTAVLSDMIQLPEAISFAKLRASYAQVGNDAQPNLGTQYYTLQGGGITRDAILPISGLKPEITTSYEVGADFRFLNGRLGLDATYYTSKSKNQLYLVTLPGASGWSSKYVNAGEVQNQGIEISLNATPVKTNDLTWDVVFNFAKNTNKVLSLGGAATEFQFGGAGANNFLVDVKIEEGKPFGELYTRGLQRNAQGQVIVGDNGLPLVTDAKSHRAGNFNPDWMGGIVNNINYKGFNLNFLIDIRQGGQIVSFTNANLYGDGSVAATLAGRDGFVVDGVTENGATNTTEVTAEQYWTALGGRNTPVGELFTYDASNIRLREVSLGYSLPSSLIGDTPFKSVKLSFVARNLFFISNSAEGFDPDQVLGTANRQGIEAFNLPSTRGYGFNLNLSF